MTDKNQDTKSALTYENWKAFNDHAPVLEAYEYPFFTDAHIIGEKSFGPYALINTIVRTTEIPAIILRADYHQDHSMPDILSNCSSTKTNTQNYHGGSLQDEIAALISLCLGIKLKSGEYIRSFSPNDDPKGNPKLHLAYKNPILHKPLTKKSIIPNTNGEHYLTNLDWLNSLPNLSPDDARALIISARRYQEALWISDFQPEFSWLLFVSSLETAANYWNSKSEPALDRLKSSRKDVYDELINFGQEHAKKIAELIVDSLGSTKKFRDFILKFRPEEPKQRPDLPFAQFQWTEDNLKKSMNKIYALRSKALHTGIPFPPLMCRPPSELQEEKPLAEKAITTNCYWDKKDMPMLLHTFEYITRNVLLNWWDELAKSNH